MASKVSENGEAGEEISQASDVVEPKVNGELNGSYEEPMEIEDSPVKQVKKINSSDISCINETDSTVNISEDLNSPSEKDAMNTGENEIAESTETSSNGVEDHNKEVEITENTTLQESKQDNTEKDEIAEDDNDEVENNKGENDKVENGNIEGEDETVGSEIEKESGGGGDDNNDDDDDVVLMEDEEPTDPLAADTNQLDGSEVPEEDASAMDCESGNVDDSFEVEPVSESDPLCTENEGKDVSKGSVDEDKSKESGISDKSNECRKDSDKRNDEKQEKNGSGVSNEGAVVKANDEKDETEKTDTSEDKHDDSLDKSKSEEDSDKTPDGKGKKKKTPQQPINVTPRRSSRNVNKPKLYVDEPDIKPSSTPTKKVSEDPDVEEIVPQDPLAMDSPVSDKKNKKTVLVSDPKRLVEIASSSKQTKPGKKEPTLVIIDTNSILSGRGPVPVSPSAALSQTTMAGPSRTQGFSILPMALPAQGMYPQSMQRQPHLKPLIAPQPATPSPPPASKPPVILPSLTDDMYVVEAPSFIVPYVYEKPPIKPLKGFVEQVEQAIKEIKAQLEKEKENAEKEKERAEKEKEQAEKMEIKTEGEEKSADEKKNSEKVDIKDATKDDDEKNEEKSDVEMVKEENKKIKDEDKDEEKMEVDVKSPKLSKEDSVTTKKEAETKEPEKTTEETSLSTKTEKDKLSDKPSGEVKTEEGEKKKSSSYFDNPLGKFFIQIGVNLVQEHVQTDLLRSQKRKKEREGAKCTPEVQQAMNSLIRSLEFSRETNEPFKLELKKCEFCSFKTESALVMAHHLETPHMRNYVYRCNFCALEVRSPHDILYHMEAEHNVRGRLERAPAFHQCPSCPFEDNQKGKLGRHLLSCAKKYRPERNQEPPLDFEPPAKIPRVSRNRPVAPMSPGTAVYQAAMSGLKQTSQHPLLPKLVPAPSPAGLIRGRGRPQMMNRYLGDMRATASTLAAQQKALAQMRPGMLYRPSGSNSQPQVLLPASYQLAGTQLYQVTNHNRGLIASPLTLPAQNAAAAVAAANAASKASSAGSSAAKLLQQPSISITPLPRPAPPPPAPTQVPPVNKPGRPAGGSKATFVICEICDGYIKDLEQLRNHMQWIHKVKIHPKMIYNRPPLNCQKCQFRFFTDQGLERHLLGSHGLVTSSMQEAANKGKDGGRCPVCGRVYQWKLLNHVARDHNMSLKPAHLSYKCTVCTATFGMYKQFENHVYSAHSVVAKRVMDKKPSTSAQPSTSSQGDMLKPLKINDEITIIPQPARAKTKPVTMTRNPQKKV